MILTFASDKGGVGKSTACAAVATELARQGGNVFIFDLDPNRTIDSWVSRAKPAGITARSVNPSDFSATLLAEIKNHEHVLIDLAGFLDAAILKAFKLSDLVIIPSGPSQPDLARVFNMVDTASVVGAACKVLFTRVSPLASRVALWSYEQIEARHIARFGQVMIERTAYKEIFANGAAPYQSNKAAGAEVYALVHEIKQAIKALQKREAA